MRDRAQIKILFLNHVSRLGGAEFSLLDTVRAFPRSKYLPHVCCPPNGPLVDELAKNAIDVHTVEFIRLRRKSPASCFLRLPSHLSALNKLRKVICDREIDIIHANGTNAMIYGALAGRITRRPVVWHLRDSVRLGLLGRMLLAASSRVIAPSEAVSNFVLDEKHNDGKVVIIPNGLDLDKWKPGLRGKGSVAHDAPDHSAIRRAYGIGENEFVVAMVAQLVQWKRHMDIIDAAEIVTRARKGIRFLLVGEDTFGDNQDYVASLKERIADKNLEGIVHFAGWRNDMVRVMEETDLVVLPSLNEPFGRVVIEAMAMGKPVVATAGGGPAEIIEDGVSGILVPPKSPVEMARAVMSLVDDKERMRRIGINGRRRVEREYDIAKIIRHYETLYEGILCDNG